jgi:hypothetical protein
MKKLFKSIISLLIAVAFLGLTVTFAFMAMTATPGFGQWMMAIVSISFLFMFFRWLAFVVHGE